MGFGYSNCARTAGEGIKAAVKQQKCGTKATDSTCPWWGGGGGGDRGSIIGLTGHCGQRPQATKVLDSYLLYCTGCAFLRGNGTYSTRHSANTALIP